MNITPDLGGTDILLSDRGQCLGRMRQDNTAIPGKQGTSGATLRAWGPGPRFSPYRPLELDSVT